MTSPDKKSLLRIMITAGCLLLVPLLSDCSTEMPPSGQTEVDLEAVAREVMTSARYCALVTTDSAGGLYVRAMDPFPPEGGLVVWMGTNPRSRKVSHIRFRPHVALYYFHAADGSYVTIHGRAELVNDSLEKQHRFKPEWEIFYRDRSASYILIRVTPERAEVVSEKAGIIGDTLTWEPAIIELSDRPAPSTVNPE